MFILRRKKFNLKEITIVLFSISRFFNSYFILCWSTYANGMFKIPCECVAIVSELLLMMLLWNDKKKLSISKKNFAILLMLLIFDIVSSVLGLTSSFDFELGDFRLLLLLFILLQINDIYKIKIFDFILKFYALIILPSLLYYLLMLVGIDIPHSILPTPHILKSNANFYYLHYPFGLIIKSTYVMPRYTGLFDEAGFIGTNCALFFAAGKGIVEKKWLILLIIEGFFSFSTAFIILIAAYYIILILTKMNKEKGIYWLIGGIVVFSLLIVVLKSASFDNIYLQTIQNRFFGDNNIFNTNYRITDSAMDTKYRIGIFSDGPQALLFGHGKYSRINDVVNASSYLLLFYDYGVIGFLIYIFIFLFIGTSFGSKRQCIPFIIVFILSIYQRPFVLNSMYLSIFVCAISYINFFNIKGDKVSGHWK